MGRMQVREPHVGDLDNVHYSFLQFLSVSGFLPTEVRTRWDTPMLWAGLRSL